MSGNFKRKKGMTLNQNSNKSPSTTLTTAMMHAKPLLNLSFFYGVSKSSRLASGNPKELHADKPMKSKRKKKKLVLEVKVSKISMLR